MTKRANPTICSLLCLKTALLEWCFPILKLQNLSMMLKLWRDAWEYAQTNENLRRLLSIQAKQWSDQTLEYSGLLVS